MLILSNTLPSFPGEFAAVLLFSRICTIRTCAAWPVYLQPTNSCYNMTRFCRWAVSNTRLRSQMEWCIIMLISCGELGLACHQASASSNFHTLDIPFSIPTTQPSWSFESTRSCATDTPPRVVTGFPIHRETLWRMYTYNLDFVTCKWIIRFFDIFWGSASFKSKDCETK